MDESNSENIQKRSRLSKIRSWYGKYERPISSLSLIGGFVFDALTLKRVDLFWENFWVIGHLVIVGTCIVLINAITFSSFFMVEFGQLFWCSILGVPI